MIPNLPPVTRANEAVGNADKPKPAASRRISEAAAMRHVYRFVIKHSYERAVEGADRGGARRGGADDVGDGGGGGRESERENSLSWWGHHRPSGTRHRRRRPR